MLSNKNPPSKEVILQTLLDCSCACREMASATMVVLVKKIRCFVTWGQTAQTVGPGPSVYQANKPTRLCQSSCYTVGRLVPFVYCPSLSFPSNQAATQRAAQCPLYSALPLQMRGSSRQVSAFCKLPFLSRQDAAVGRSVPYVVYPFVCYA